MNKMPGMVLITFLLLITIPLCFVNSQNAASPVAETINGELTKVCDSLFTVVIFYKNTGCRTCYETLGEYLQLFIPRKSIGVTYWIDEGANRCLRRKANTRINVIFEMPGKVVFTPENLSEADKQLNLMFKIPNFLLNPEDCPSVALINKRSGLVQFYETSDIIDYFPIISIKSCFKEIFIDFLSGYVKNTTEIKNKGRENRCR